MDRAERAMVFGQMLLWTLLGVLLAVRIHVSHAFNRASHQVAVSIFETSNLKPFAMIGLVDVLLVAGGMVLSTVQSLDFSFRPENYTNALVVAVPAMLFLAIYPMWPLHRRLSAYRTCQLHEVNEQIRGALDSLQPDHMERLEILLQRRERVLAASTWPMDVDTLRRFVFYIIIPPLAWVGAAMVESLLEGFLRK